MFSLRELEPEGQVVSPHSWLIDTHSGYSGHRVHRKEFSVLALLHSTLLIGSLLLNRLLIVREPRSIWIINIKAL